MKRVMEDSGITFDRTKMEHVSHGNSSGNKSGLPIDDDG